MIAYILAEVEHAAHTCAVGLNAALSGKVRYTLGGIAAFNNCTRGMRLLQSRRLEYVCCDLAFCLSASDVPVQRVRGVSISHRDK